jgi:predicted class III extradiol MEMO1 family dioxygenase
MGARFGDAETIDGEALGAIRRTDRAALDAAATGDADAWFDAVATHGDSTRICGYSAVYALLRAAAPGPGTLLRYEQSVEEGGSVVTCAAMAWG